MHAAVSVMEKTYNVVEGPAETAETTAATATVLESVSETLKKEVAKAAEKTEAKVVVAA